ncbi:uncharacterized protein C2845_PM12G32030 [Panicum miliaceum]|uniref:Uncharacterized protein n=1 Tax=Panicum miliaceum TaxID=4540 RepID=A0A3L6QIB8_PANMI|nr:uncharacterized protein C2845_PM12G32030 [Panicum miliaceum]
MEQTYQFEAFVYRRPASTYFSKSWQCQLLPSLPYVHNTKQWHSFPQISSYAVGNGGSEICISVQGRGTYCLNTTSYTWTEVGKWTLPFNGKVEYVLELKLWFGISASDHTLAAADLSAMDSQPQLLDRWKELDLPEEWKECKDSQLISLGSGKFCIARFLHTTTPKGDIGDELIDQNLAVLTGVEVALHAHGNEPSRPGSSISNISNLSLYLTISNLDYSRGRRARLQSYPPKGMVWAWSSYDQLLVSGDVLSSPCGHVSI